MKDGPHTIPFTGKFALLATEFTRVKLDGRRGTCRIQMNVVEMRRRHLRRE
jgi:hypothetical protein